MPGGVMYRFDAFLFQLFSICGLQQHGENKKLKRQSQMLLDKLNKANKPLHDLLPNLADIPDETTDTTTDDSSVVVNQLSCLNDKINRLLLIYTSLFTTIIITYEQLPFIRQETEQDATLSLRRPRDAPNIWVPWKLCVSTKAVDDCARISTLQSYHYSAVKLFSKYSNKCDHGT